MFNGKTHYKWPFSIAMLVITRGHIKPPYLRLGNSPACNVWFLEANALTWGHKPSAGDEDIDPTLDLQCETGEATVVKQQSNSPCLWTDFCGFNLTKTSLTSLTWLNIVHLAHNNLLDMLVEPSGNWQNLAKSCLWSWEYGIMSQQIKLCPD